MVSAVATRILEALGETFVRRAGALLEPLVDGLTEPLADVDELLQPTERGWARGLDLEETPIPAWIGAATGTKVPGGLTLEQQRDYVRDRPAWRRGTPQAIRGAVRAVLVGSTRRVELVERNGSPWRLKVRVWALELPSYDPDGPDTGQEAETEVVAAARTQVPVGIVVDPDVEVVEGAATYAHLAAEHGTYAELLVAFPTPAHAAAHVPEEGTVF